MQGTCNNRCITEWPRRYSPLVKAASAGERKHGTLPQILQGKPRRQAALLCDDNQTAVRVSETPPLGLGVCLGYGCVETMDHIAGKEK